MLLGVPGPRPLCLDGCWGGGGGWLASPDHAWWLRPGSWGVSGWWWEGERETVGELGFEQTSPV